MPQTRNPSVLTNYLVTLAKSTAVRTGFRAVYYGDQTIIGKVPALCIEPASTLREYKNAPFQTKNTFEIRCVVYHSSNEGVELVQQECDEITETFVDIVNRDALSPTLNGTHWNGLVLDAMDSEREYGYKIKADTLMRANTVTFVVRTITNLVD